MTKKEKPIKENTVYLPDYKEQFIALLNRMHRDNNDGLIPIMIAEGVKECEAHDPNSTSKDLVYWTTRDLQKK